MGARRKLVYQRGILADALSDERLFTWSVAQHTIHADAYAVELITQDDRRVTLHEDEVGVWLTQDGNQRCLTAGPLRLPWFEGHPYTNLLRILHHEMLINIVNGRPVPNRFVCPRPWYRDAAMMAMCLVHIRNLALIEAWINGLSTAPRLSDEVVEVWPPQFGPSRPV